MNSLIQEYTRIAQMLSGLTVSMPIALISSTRITQIESRSATEVDLEKIATELLRKLREVHRNQGDFHVQFI